MYVMRATLGPDLNGKFKFTCIIHTHTFTVPVKIAESLHSLGIVTVTLTD